jgi:hypothetical protein
LPFYAAALTGAPEAWHSHDGCQSKFSFKAAWWAFNLVNQYSDLNFGLINKEVKAKARTIETEAFKFVALWDREVANLSEAAALQELTRKSNAFAEAKLAEWWEFAGHIWAKFGRYVVTFNETEVGGEDAAGQAYPTWWLESADVGFLSWTRDGPYHGVPDMPVKAIEGTISKAFRADEAAIGGRWRWMACLIVISHILIAAVMYFVGVQRGQKSIHNLDCYVAHV